MDAYLAFLNESLALRRAHMELKRALNALALELRWRRLARSLYAELRRVEVARHARLYGKANFNPNQPRVPAGNPDGGQWTDGPGGPANGSDKYSAARKRWRGPKPDGHHFVPHGVYSKLPFQPETQKVFDQAKTGKLYATPHRWSQEHVQYNKAVAEHLGEFMMKRGITPERMTPNQARAFIDEVKRSADPRIRRLNMRIYMREIMYWLRRAPRVNE